MFYLYNFCCGEILDYEQFSSLFDIVEYLRSNNHRFDDVHIYYGNEISLKFFKNFLDN